MLSSPHLHKACRDGLDWQMVAQSQEAIRLCYCRGYWYVDRWADYPVTLVFCWLSIVCMRLYTDINAHKALWRPSCFWRTSVESALDPSVSVTALFWLSIGGVICNNTIAINTFQIALSSPKQQWNHADALCLPCCHDCHHPFSALLYTYDIS